MCISLMNIKKLQASPEPLPLDLWCLPLLIPCLPTLDSCIYMSTPKGKEFVWPLLCFFSVCCALDIRMHALWSTHT